MPLRRGEVRGFDFNRMVVEFTMLNQDQVIPCAISTAAMDDLEDKRFLHSRFAKAASPQLNADRLTPPMWKAISPLFFWRSFSLPVNGRMLYRLIRMEHSGSG